MHELHTQDLSSSEVLNLRRFLQRTDWRFVAPNRRINSESAMKACHRSKLHPNANPSGPTQRRAAPANFILSRERSCCSTIIQNRRQIAADRVGEIPSWR
jgi:hypothetical protein